MKENERECASDFRTMKFLVLCFMAAAIGNARGALSPNGEHLCMHEERYIDIIKVVTTVPVKVKETRWCWSIPPRCTVVKDSSKIVFEEKEVPKTRLVPVCCKGYLEVVEESKCIPVCTEPCLNGNCTAPEKCSCESGYSGDHCEKPCESGTWGRGCLEKCDCHNNALCDGVHGKCICTPGWTGLRCDSPCEPGFYGLNCEFRCDCGWALCNHETGICETTTQVVTTTTEITAYETTTETQHETNSTESMVTESSTISDTTQVENSTVQDPSNSTINLLRIYPEEEDTGSTDKVNETSEDNKIEHSQDLMGVEISKFHLFNIFKNLSITCGIFLLIFVVAMSSVMVNHYRKIRKTVYECNAIDKSSNTQNFPLHRFYGGSVLPSKTILDNQMCTANVDLRIEQPKLMTFKPLPDETCKTENKGSFDNSRETAIGRHIVQFKCDETEPVAYICTRCTNI